VFLIKNLFNLGEILKFRVSILGFIFAIIGVYLSGQVESLRQISTLIALLVVPLTIFFAFVVNDIVDADLDKLTKPHRAIPSGKVTLRDAIILAIILAISALLISWMTGIASGIFATVNLFLCVAYSLWFKQTLLLGNMTTAYLNASVIVYGSLSVSAVNGMIIWVAALIFFFSLAYEILYAVEDLQGDTKGGVMTTAHYLGRTKSLWLIRGLCLFVIAIAMIPLLSGSVSILFLISMGVLCVIPVLWVTYKLSPGTGDEVIRRSRTVLTFIYYLSVIPILILHTGF